MTICRDAVLPRGLLLLVPQSTDKVESSFDRNADFSTFRTYAWNKGHEAFNPAAHKIIAGAIDAQMAKLGYTKADAGFSESWWSSSIGPGRRLIRCGRRTRVAI